MATPNYGYEKRQKELAKKRKKEDKLRDKANRKAGVEPDSPEDPQEPGQGTAEVPGQPPQP